MSTFGNVLRLVVIALLIGVTAYAFVIYIVPWLPAAAVVIYFCGAVAMLAISVMTLLEAQRARTPAEELVQHTQRELARRDVSAFIAYYAPRVGTIIAVTAAALVWPLTWAMGLYFAMQGHSIDDPRKTMLEGVLNLTEHLQSLALLVWILLSIAIAQIGFVGDRYPRLFVFTLLASILLKLAAIIITPGGLPAMLRRKTTQPYGAFILILLIEAVSLLLGCHYLRISDPSGAVEGGLAQTASLLFNPAPLPQRILNFLGGQQFEQQHIGFALVGLVFYLALFKNLLDFGSFKRQDSDHLLLAQVELQRGHPVKAIKHLDDISQEHKSQPQALLLRSVALVALSEYDRAKQTAAQGMQQAVEDLGPLNDDQIFASLLGCCLTVPLAQKARTGLFRWMANAGASDWVLANFAISTLVVVRQTAAQPDEATSFAEQLEQQIASRQASAPLTTAVIKIHLGQLDGARERLNAARPNYPIESFMRHVILLLTAIADPTTTKEQDKISFSNWADTTLPVLKRDVEELKDWHEKLAALSMLYGLRRDAVQLEHDSAEQFHFLAHTLSVDLRGRKGLEVFVQSLDRMAAA